MHAWGIEIGMSTIRADDKIGEGVYGRGGMVL